MPDVARLKESWSAVARHGDEVPLFFYSTLFLTHPETRAMFPVSMAAQRDKLVGALGRIVSQADELPELVPLLHQLGAHHRRFDLRPEHYPAVGGALVATLEHFLADSWDSALAKAWTEAYELIVQVMTEGADKAAEHSPPWWDAEVVAHERRTVDVAVLQVRPDRYRLDYAPGQSVGVETHLRPKSWRYYSPANAPRQDGTIELHVRLVPGGQVSTALVQQLQVGDVLRLAAPLGHRLTLPRLDRPLLLVAGGTGLAPLKALVDQLAGAAAQQRVHLCWGVRTPHDLYDLDALQRLAREHPWLTLSTAVANDPARPNEQRMAIDAAGPLAHWRDHDVYVCGPDEMVRRSVDQLTQAGISQERITWESLIGLGGEQYGPPEPALTHTKAKGA